MTRHVRSLVCWAHACMSLLAKTEILPNMKNMLTDARIQNTEELAVNRHAMTPVGFEPTQLALVELESTPLDHSSKVSMRAHDNSAFQIAHLACVHIFICMRVCVCDR